MLRATAPSRGIAKRISQTSNVRLAPVRSTAAVSGLLYTLAEEAVKAGAVAERTGTVDAPIGIVIGASIVVAIAATALVPLALKPGDDAARDIFAGKNLGKSTVKKPKPGSKAAGGQ